MKGIQGHFYVLTVVTALWAWFLIFGLSSNYYQDWSLSSQLVFIVVMPAMVMVYLAPGMIKVFGKSRYKSSSLFSAFYFSVPFLVYDYAYLGMHEGHGLGYLVDYWYLSLFSLLPWFVFPIVGHIKFGQK